MRIITGVGYYATGSGVIQDLCKEFSSCEILTDYEIRFLQDPDGISDLQYNLVDNNHRHNTGFAIKRFKKYVKFLNGSIYTKRYRKYFGESFSDITDDYLSSIVKVHAKTWWHGDQLEKGRLFYFLDILYGMITAKFRNEGRMSLLKGREDNYYTYLSLDEFLTATRHYTNTLFNEARKTDLPFLFVNQLVSPSNVDRYTAYFDDIKVVIVDRDPRDLYIAANKVYCEGIIPADNVMDFCEWYRVTREHRKYEKHDGEKALFVHFEDLIYKYDETTNRVIDFLGMNRDDHVSKKKYFNPSKSIRGTKLIEKYPEFKEDIKYIEDHLSEYTYKYQ